MKIRLQTRYANPHVTATPGTVLDVSDEEARDLIAGNYATEVKESEEKAVPTPTAETAAVVPPELAASRAGRRGSAARTTAPAAPKE